MERPYGINAAKTAGAHPRVRTDAIFDSMQRLSASRLSRSPQPLGLETVGAGAGADEGHGALGRSGGAGDVPGFSNDDVSESSDEEEDEGKEGEGVQAGHEALGAADEGGSEVWLMQFDVRVCARSCA